MSNIRRSRAFRARLPWVVTLGLAVVLGFVWQWKPGPGAATPLGEGAAEGGAAQGKAMGPESVPSAASLAPTEPERPLRRSASGARTGGEPDATRDAGQALRPVLPSPLPAHDAKAAEPAGLRPRDAAREGGTASLVFVVLDARQSPLSEAVVTLASEADSPSATTGRDGVAQFEGLLAGSYDFRVESPERPTLAAQAPVTLAVGEERTIELRVPDFDRVVRGHVVDQDGAAVVGLAVAATPQVSEGLAPAAVQAATTSAGGLFSIPGLAPGEYELRTVARDAYPSVGALVRAGDDSVILRVVENADFRLSGSVTDASGEPLEGVRVTPIGHSGAPVFTGDDGAYELPLEVRLLRGAYPVSFRLAEYEEFRVTLAGEQIEARGELRRDVVLQRIESPVEVTGRLSDGRGSPVPGELVHLHSPTTQTRYQASSDDEGWFFFSEVAARADYTLDVRPRTRFRDYSLEGLDLSADGPPLEVVLETLPTGRVRGLIVTPQGDPLPGFRLLLRNAAALAQPVELIGDGAGYFDLQEVPAGSLTFQTRSLPRFRVGVLELAPGGDELVELVLDLGTAELEGRVLDGHGNAVVGAEVTLGWTHQGALRSDSTRHELTDEAGVFRFSGLGLGEHSVQVSAPGLAGWKSVVPAGESWVEIRLLPPGESQMITSP